jgi:3-oxoacyl-[acyl-carrier protein] reductase
MMIGMAITGTKAVLRGMLVRRDGRVLHIASIAGWEGNALAPAVIRTPLVEAMPEAQVTYMTERIPMRRSGTLEEVVAMVESIVSPGCSFTTGFTFDLSGGRATC